MSLLQEGLKFVLTQKGSPALMLNGYMFYKIRDGANDRVFWRCTQHIRGCEARLTTVATHIESCRNNHDHLPEMPRATEVSRPTVAAVYC